MLNYIYLYINQWHNNPLILGLIAGLIITVFNTVGALLVLFAYKTISQKFLDLILGFAAGLMLAASFTSLIIPGIKVGGVWPVVLGIMLGAFCIDFANNHIPHTHWLLKSNKISKKISPLVLFILAITIHNMPEGLSVGIAIGSNHLKEAIPLMIAIGIQNVPEGFSVAFSHFAENSQSKLRSAWIGIASGLVEIPLAILGVFLVSFISPILPYAMGFGAGAMLYVISNEIIPQTHNKGYERIATTGTIIGIILMLVLDMGL